MSESRGPRFEDRGSEGRIDIAIDRVVREILDVEQPAGFRRRVMARVDHPVYAASGFSRKIVWVGAPLAAATIVVLALLVPREQIQPQRPAPIAVATVQPLPEPSTEPAPRAERGKPEARGQEPRGAQPTQARRADGIVAAATTDVAGTTIQIEPLRRMVPIEFTPLSQDPIAPAEIAVRPLTTISELQIAPLNPPDRRN